jgi:7-cyano-7-deazaguanine synthase
LEDGVKTCQKLGLDYKEIYSRTNTSYKPIQIKGKWYSDYKTGSSVERIESFMKLGLEDPLQYADENGNLVSWNFVKNDVNKVIEEYNLINE